MPADTPRFRPAGPGDAAALLALMRDLYAEDHLVFDELAAGRAARELLAAPALGVVLLIESGGAVAGYLALTLGFSLEFHGRYALLDELYLAPSARGRGWGRLCLEQAVAAARERGVASLRLEVNHANEKARALYLRSGFADNRRDLLTRWLN